MLLKHVIVLFQAEKNRMQAATNALATLQSKTGPMRLYVGSLHFNITEDMLRGIFEPFGKVRSSLLVNGLRIKASFLM